METEGGGNEADPVVYKRQIDTRISREWRDKGHVQAAGNIFIWHCVQHRMDQSPIPVLY